MLENKKYQDSSWIIIIYLIKENFDDRKANLALTKASLAISGASVN